MKIALLIGINYYNTDNKLNGCINDINDIKKMLINLMDFKEKDIFIMNDYHGIKPTKNNIMEQLQNFIIKSNDASECWFHYSGHGCKIADKSGDENDGYDEVICPIDSINDNSNFICDDELYNMIKNINKKAKCIFIMDCCHSGTNLDLLNSVTYKNENEVYYHKNIGKNELKNHNIIMISGCLDYQTSADAFNINNNYKYNGALTSTLLNIINKNKKISYGRMIITLHKELKIKKFTQIPMMSFSKKINLEESFLACIDNINNNDNNDNNDNINNNDDFKKNEKIYNIENKINQIISKLSDVNNDIDDITKIIKNI
jgi:metacaspase-1